MSLDQPPISVVVPVYNHAAYLVESLESIASQSYAGPIELIVIDDASSDDSYDVASRTIAALRPRRAWAGISLDRHANNAGAHATISEGIARATAPFITILNSDDVFMPTRLATLVPAMSENGSEFGFTGVVGIDASSRHLSSGPAVSEVNAFIEESVPGLPSLEFGFLRHQLAISSGNMVFTRALHDDIGGFCALKYVHDWDFALAAILLTSPTFVPEALYGYRTHSSNSFSSLAAIAETETEIAMRRFFHRIMSGRVRNPLAPTPRNWPGVFEQYLGLYGAEQYWKTMRESLPFYARR